MTTGGGCEVAATLRRLSGMRPVVTVGRRRDAVRGRDDLMQASFTIDLVRTLNAAVEQRVMLERAALMRRVEVPGTLPLLAGVDGAHQSLAPATPAQRVPRRPRALLIDDSPTVRHQLRMALAQIGVECDEAGTAQKARVELAARSYEILIVDVVMPDVDGLKLVREIRRDRSMHRVPIVVLTTRSSPFDLLRGALSGAEQLSRQAGVARYAARDRAPLSSGAARRSCAGWIRRRLERRADCRFPRQERYACAAAGLFLA